MEIVFKASALLLVSALIGLLLRKNAPELALVLSFTAVLLVSVTALHLAVAFQELLELIQTMAGETSLFLLPILKCVLIGLLTKMAADLCRDVSQAAAASSLELLGTVCAVSISMPQIMSVLKAIGGLL